MWIRLQQQSNPDLDKQERGGNHVERVEEVDSCKEKITRKSDFRQEVVSNPSTAFECVRQCDERLALEIFEWEGGPALPDYDGR
jgi:hypothetical protein